MRKPAFVWSGLILLVLLLVGLILFRPTPPAAPLPGAQDSPLGVASSPLPQATSPLPTVAVTPGPFQLTVLHTNDTWGYLLPCG